MRKVAENWGKNKKREREMRNLKPAGGGRGDG